MGFSGGSMNPVDPMDPWVVSENICDFLVHIKDVKCGVLMAIYVAYLMLFIHQKNI